MKLRIHGDSLRFRLTQGEVAKLANKAKVSESVHFQPLPGSILTYSIEPSEHDAQVSALFRDEEILVRVPTSAVELWAGSDQVGIEYTHTGDEGRQLRILIEKDFRCLQARPEEDESDNFPHPDEARNQS